MEKKHDMRRMWDIIEFFWQIAMLTILFGRRRSGRQAWTRKPRQQGKKKERRKMKDRIRTRFAMLFRLHKPGGKEAYHLTTQLDDTTSE